MHDQSFEIRRATPDDAEAIAEAHLQSHLETYPPLVGIENYRPSDKMGKMGRLEQWTNALQGPGVAFVAVADGGVVVGFTHALGNRITTLYLLAAWQRRGIGRALLRRLLEDLEGRGFEKATFAVLAVNVRAIAFYESQGARRTGVVTVEEPDLPGISYEDGLYEIPTSVPNPKFAPLLV
jgi:ribosomal protein S18 acetylase RimI-like enzyme